MAEQRLGEYYKEISADLVRTVNFWLKFSHDDEYGYEKKIYSVYLYTCLLYTYKCN